MQAHAEQERTLEQLQDALGQVEVDPAVTRLMGAGELREEDADALGLLYAAPVVTLVGVCDRQPEREEECLAKLDAHVRLFYRTFHIKKEEKA